MKTTFSFLLVALILPSVLSAQGLKTFERWDKNDDGKLVVGELPANVRKNFSKVDADKSGAISLAEHQAFLKKRGQQPNRNSNLKVLEDLDYVGDKNPRQTLNLFLPTNATSTNLPLIVFIHGGGWRAGDKKFGLNKLRPTLADGSYAGASIGYRLTDEAIWPAQIHDCKAAIRYLRANARTHGIDPERIGIWGTSAGGHLVSMLGVSGGVAELEGTLGDHDDTDSRVQAVINFYGPSQLLTMNDFDSTMDHNAPDSPESKLIGAPIQQAKEKARAASPMHYVSKDDAPILHVHGDKDPLVPLNQSQVFDQALRELGVASTLLTIKDGGHGGFENSQVKEWIGRFFDHHLKGTR